jgi:hypothetical protein
MREAGTVCKRASATWCTTPEAHSREYKVRGLAPCWILAESIPPESDFVRGEVAKRLTEQVLKDVRPTGHFFRNLG